VAHDAEEEGQAHSRALEEERERQTIKTNLDFPPGHTRGIFLPSKAAMVVASFIAGVVARPRTLSMLLDSFQFNRQRRHPTLGAGGRFGGNASSPLCNGLLRRSPPETG
jgi:hypothetical protein